MFQTGENYMVFHSITDLKNSIYDGLFANIFATLTGGVFLTGFALYLGMSDAMIGILASVPFLVTAFQLPASYYLGKNGGRKRFAFWGAATGRFIWIPILIVAAIPYLSSHTRSLFILGLFFMSHSCISVSYVSWLSWISDLVPDNIRGKFFGSRNMICGIAGMLAVILFGNILDHLKSHPSDGFPFGFGITFMTAVIFGMLSLYFLGRISEPKICKPADAVSFKELIYLPFREKNFRNFLIFSFSWSFSVYFASPFFTLYFLRNLKFSYGFVAVLNTISACADLIGMQVWGRISDKVKNRVIIRFASWVAVFLPLAWVTVTPGAYVLPIFLHIVGGGFWAGINLSMNNLLLRISPKENKGVFLSIFNMLAGLGAALGPILGGLAINFMSDLDLRLFNRELAPLQMVFLTSTLLRLSCIQLFKSVHEPDEATVGQLVRVLRSVRGMNVATGFNYLLHPFIEITRED
jgi:MFS family permease